ncbi:MAG: hypothetical protein KAW12_04070 [Candidatus Aminicenantes bacterium]|nr:hypothetical protein [Candidatus Aminicenantes bacterium]
MFNNISRFLFYKILKKGDKKNELENLFVDRFENRSKITWNYYSKIFREKEFSPFFVLATPRTGSTILVDYLNNTENIGCMHEVLNARTAIGIPRESSKRKALAHIKYTINNIKGSIRGVKFFSEQLQFFGIEIEDIQKIFPDAKYIVIYRKSLIEQYVSLMLAQETGKWINEPYNEKIIIRPDDYKEFCLTTQKAYSRFFNCPIIRARSIVMAYEDILIDAQHEFDTKIFPFLGEKKCIIRTKFKKQNTKKIDEVIENYEDVVDVIKNKISRQLWA